MNPKTKVSSKAKIYEDREKLNIETEKRMSSGRPSHRMSTCDKTAMRNKSSKDVSRQEFNQAELEKLRLNIEHKFSDLTEENENFLNTKSTSEQIFNHITFNTHINNTNNFNSNMNLRNRNAENLIIMKENDFCVLSESNLVEHLRKVIEMKNETIRKFELDMAGHARTIEELRKQFAVQDKGRFSDKARSIKVKVRNDNTQIIRELVKDLAYCQYKLRNCSVSLTAVLETLHSRFDWLNSIHENTNSNIVFEILDEIRDKVIQSNIASDKDSNLLETISRSIYNRNNFSDIKRLYLREEEPTLDDILAKINAKFRSLDAILNPSLIYSIEEKISRSNSRHVNMIKSIMRKLLPTIGINNKPSIKTLNRDSMKRGVSQIGDKAVISFDASIQVDQYIYEILNCAYNVSFLQFDCSLLNMNECNFNKLVNTILIHMQNIKVLEINDFNSKLNQGNAKQMTKLIELLPVRDVYITINNGENSAREMIHFPSVFCRSKYLKVLSISSSNLNRQTDFSNIAIMLEGSFKLDSFQLRNSYFEKVGLELLLNSLFLHHRPLKSLDLSRSQFSDGCVDSLCSYLNQVPKYIKELNLSYTSFEDSDLLKLSNAVSKLNKLEFLNLANSLPLGMKQDRLLENLVKVKALNLSDNTCLCIESLINMLNQSEDIENLDVSNCKLNTNEIATLLKCDNKNLTLLKIQGNRHEAGSIKELSRKLNINIE